MAWYLRCAPKKSPDKFIGWISSGGVDNQNVGVSLDKKNALAIERPLYTWENKTYLKAPGSGSDWYFSDDAFYSARWAYWNTAKPVIWDNEGITSTLSFGVPTNSVYRRLGKRYPNSDWLSWVKGGEDRYIVLLTWEEW
jgi:hypothetical protein